MSSVIDVIRHYATDLTVLRPYAEKEVDGYVTKSTALVVPPYPGARGHMQTYSPKELRNVPEGQNTLEWWHVWTLFEIKEDDRITDGVVPYITVERIEFWRQGPLWHGHGVKITDARQLPGGILLGMLPKLVPVFTGTVG